MRNADESGQNPGRVPQIQPRILPPRPLPRGRACVPNQMPACPPPLPLSSPGEVPPAAPPARGVLRGFARLALVLGAVSAVTALISAEVEFSQTTGRERGWPYVIALLCGLSSLTFTLAVGWVVYRQGRHVLRGLAAALVVAVMACLWSHWTFPVQAGYGLGFCCAWGLVGLVIPHAAHGVYAWVASGFRG